MPKKVKKPNVKIKPDTKILLEIELKDNADGIRNLLSLNSYVEEVAEDGCMLIHAPIHQGYYYTLSAEMPILLYFFNNNLMYSITVRFQAHIKRDNLLYAKVLQVGDARQGQRRNCYRLQCSLPVTVELAGTDSTDDTPPIEGQMIDFSDGGMLFAVNESIAAGEKVNLTFDIGQEETVSGKVLRSHIIQDELYKYKVAVKFQHKDKAKKERFFKYIMEQQRAKLKRRSEDKHS
jgi:c-di-GMP-binding flagellar brake protein YcgR